MMAFITIQISQMGLMGVLGKFLGPLSELRIISVKLEACGSGDWLGRQIILMTT